MDNRAIFIANLGHEFKTPLNAVLGFSQLGMSADSMAACHAYFSKINCTAKEMICMINAMMDYTQVADPHYPLDYSNFNLRSLLNQLPYTFSTLSRHEKAVLTLDIDARVPSMIESDPFRLEQVFTELIKNTTTYAPGSSMHATITVSNASETERTLQMHFVDYGKGIPEATLSQIFRPYHTLKNSNQARFSGISLGLPLIHQIFERMNGSVTVKNTAQGGLSVCLELPLNISETLIPEDATNGTVLTQEAVYQSSQKEMGFQTLQLDLSVQNWTEKEIKAILNELSQFKEFLDLKKPMHCLNFLTELAKKFPDNASLAQLCSILEPYIRQYQFNDASNLLEDYMSKFGGEEAYEAHR